MAGLLDWLSKQKDSAMNDYAGLMNNYPNAQKFGNGLINNISQHVPSNEDFQSPEKMGEWSMAAAMNAPMGLMFTGPKSAGWNHEAANTATKLLDNGADPSQVWKDHLIGRMPDGKLFSEIDDRGVPFSNPTKNNRMTEMDNLHLNADAASMSDKEMMKELDGFNGSTDEYIKSLQKKGYDSLYNINKGEYTPEYVMPHDDLYSAYPSLENLNVKYRNDSMFPDGSASISGNTVTLSPKTGKSGLLHELQHAIQNQEGWAKGGSPGMFPDVSEKKKLLGDANILTRMYMHTGDIKSARELFIKRIGREPEYFSESYALSGHHPDTFLKERDALLSPEENYQRLTGEAQARATQDRMNMGMQQRRDTYPLAGDKLSDIPLNQLINRYRNDGPSMSVDSQNPNTGLSNTLSDYQGTHKAPMKGDASAPLHDLSAIYPEDIYSNKAAQYYGDYGGSHPMDRESINAMHAAKGKPDSLVTMFRSVPSEPTIEKQIALLEKHKSYIQKNGKVPPTANTNLDRSDYYDDISNKLDNLYAMPQQPAQAKPSINNGDWVTLSRAYAKEHGQAHLNNNYKIISKKVPARKLFTNADSIHEFGYDESGKANLGLLGAMTGAGLSGAYLYGNKNEK